MMRATIVPEKVYESVKKGLKEFEDFARTTRRFLQSDEKTPEAIFNYHKLTAKEKIKAAW